MERSKITLRKWAFGIHLSATNLKGVSSLKLHRDLHITQKSAWFMAHRIREALVASTGILCLLKRAHDGTYYQFSPKDLPRYLDEMAARQSLRDRDAIDLMGKVEARIVARRLTNVDPTAGGPAYPKR